MALAACSHAPIERPTEARGERPRAADARAAAVASTLLGRPYHYGGSGPRAFDCSGLVYYSYARAGVRLPRSTAGQKRYTRPVARDDLRRGDLLFFTQEGRAYSHVGIYLGHGRFVHAPSTGKRVRIDRLWDPYWLRHFLGARRVPR